MKIEFLGVCSANSRRMKCVCDGTNGTWAPCVFSFAETATWRLESPPVALVTRVDCVLPVQFNPAVGTSESSVASLGREECACVFATG